MGRVRGPAVTTEYGSMKKLIILPLVAVAALSLAACKPNAPDNGTVGNDLGVNADEPIVDSNVIVDDASLNGTEADNASNATN
jgi:hypothetical protein